MKTFSILILSISSLGASAQQLIFQSGVEKTVAGFEYGASISYETKGMWALGSFYQTGISRNNAEGRLEQKSLFYGAIFQAPIAKSDRLAFLFNLRTGFINEKFFVVVPSLETRVHVNKRIGVSVGTALRMGFPSFSAKVFIKLFKH